MGLREKRRSTAALQNARLLKCAGEHGHVLECGSVLPLSNQVMRAHAGRSKLELEKRPIKPERLIVTSRSSSRRRRARRFSSRFHHCGPNRSQPFDVCTSRFGGTRRTPLLNWCFSFHRPVSFSNSRIRHRSALDIRLARLR